MRHCLCLLLVLLAGCALYPTPAPTVIAVFAHPDDETWIAGTLMHLQQQGINLVPVYVTSGDRGSDRSGRGLNGPALAKIREQETQQALFNLTLPEAIFLRYPDGNTASHLEAIANDINAISKQYQAPVMLCFSQGGITQNSDHVALADLCQSQYSDHLLVFSLSQTRANILEATAQSHHFQYPIKSAVSDSLISHRIGIEPFKTQKVNALDSHSTQFPKMMVQAFADFVDQAPYEELIVTSPSNRVQKVLDALSAQNHESH